jgi:broad specificity phosphatase PhoE
MDNSTTFYIVRHGETVWNTEHRMQGHGDSPLTEKGKQEIAELEKVFHEIHFDHVFSSDLFRTQHTAKLLTIRKKLAINTTALLRERFHGIHEGKIWEEYVAENKALIDEYEALSEQEQTTFSYDGGIETTESMIQRLLEFLRETAVTYTGKTLLVVSHGGILRALLQHLGKPTMPGHGKVQNLAYIQLLSNGDEFEIVKTEGITFA